MTTRWTFETDIDMREVRSEDGGMHLIAYCLTDGICPLYVNILSEEEHPHPGDHPALRALIGRRVRVTIEDVGPGSDRR